MRIWYSPLLLVCAAPVGAQQVSVDRIPAVVKAAKWVCPRYYISKGDSWKFYVKAAKEQGLNADEQTLLISYCVLWGDGHWAARNPPPPIVLERR